ncbi:phage holin family protein [Georgenia sp. H159]|uniref:phage holin family protein n=1 Tax=Georgenia sp. H159 TaxID=3076115 RepID=UPI002D791033|nr:phage holin family protein [Georgenia sp. H159]
MIALHAGSSAWHDLAMRFLVRLLVSSVAIWVTSLFLTGISLTEREGWEQVVVVAVVGLVFTLVNLVVKPIVHLFALPLTILTLGLFSLVINALMLMLTSWLTSFTEWGLYVDGFWWALLAAVIISVISWVLNAILSPDRD